MGMQNDDLYFLLALLNSRLLRDYVYVLHTAYKWVQPQIEQHVLASLPVPVCSMEEKEAIIERAKRLYAACSTRSLVVELQQNTERLLEEQERSICVLYEAVLQRKVSSISNTTS
jgi:restriction endonuclease S subunit